MLLRLFCIDEAKEIRDKARAMEVYAAQAMNIDAEKQAASIRIRAEAKAGKLLTQTEKAKNQYAGQATRPATLKDMGISKDQSSKWQISHTILADWLCVYSFPIGNLR